MKSEIYKTISGVLHQLKRDTENAPERLNQLENLLPSGSGIDCGTKIDREKSTGEKIVLNVDFHCMNENGYYDGWIYLKVIVTPSLYHGFNLRVVGRDYKGMVKDYIADTYYTALTELVEYNLLTGSYETESMKNARERYEFLKNTFDCSLCMYYHRIDKDGIIHRLDGYIIPANWYLVGSEIRKDVCPTCKKSIYGETND